MDDLDLRLHAPRPVTVSLAGGPVRVVEEALPDSVRLLIAMPLAPLETRLRQLRLSLMVGLPSSCSSAGSWVPSRRRLPFSPSVASPARPTWPRGGRPWGDHLLRPPGPGSRRRDRPPDPRHRRAAGAGVSRTAARPGDRGAAATVPRRCGARAPHTGRDHPQYGRRLLAADDDAAARRDALAAIAQEATRLGSLVGDLLALAREGTAAALAAREPVYLDDLTHNVVGRLRRLPIAAGREIAFGEFAEAPVRANPALAERAIFALVHNGLVHAPGSRIELSAGHDGATSWMRVRDWGPGVPPGAEAAGVRALRAGGCGDAGQWTGARDRTTDRRGP